MSSTNAWLRTWISEPELGLCRLMNGWASGMRVRAAFRIISRLGDGPAWYGLIFLLAWRGGDAGETAALHLAVIGVVCALLYRNLKRWTRRPRPFARYGSIQAHIAPLDEFSFPSGHTLHAVAFSTVACFHFPVLIWILLPFSILIALSRVILGLHYPSDVLAAALIGGTLAEASIAIL